VLIDRSMVFIYQRASSKKWINMKKNESLGNGNEKAALASAENGPEIIVNRMSLANKFLAFVVVEVDKSKMDKATAKKYLASLAVAGKVVPEFVVGNPYTKKYDGKVIRTKLEVKIANEKIIKDLNKKADELGIKRHNLSEQERKTIRDYLIGDNRLVDSFSNELQDFAAKHYGEVELLAEAKIAARSR
jgi:hypothetical protein